METSSGITHRRTWRSERELPLAIHDDCLAVEEPLEIRIEFGAKGARERCAISITMRTPGHDFELAAGFLFTEGIVRTAGEISAIGFCGGRQNVVRVELREDIVPDLQRLERHFYTSSSCGVCGKSSIEALRTQCAVPRPTAGDFRVSARTIRALPERLSQHQAIFKSTGGLHASATFSANGEIQNLREDVGRHNALDKLIGRALLDSHVPLHDCLLLVSGRASFELVQKAAMAGIPALAAVGAPSSLAVELAAEYGMALFGFVRADRFNVYCGEGVLI